MIRDITIPAKHCTCDVCGHQWVSVAVHQPDWCANCKSRQWNGLKRRWRGKEIKLPAPRKRGRPKSITLTEEE